MLTRRNLFMWLFGAISVAGERTTARADDAMRPLRIVNKIDVGEMGPEIVRGPATGIPTELDERALMKWLQANSCAIRHMLRG